MNIPRGVLDEIIRHARDSQPDECCGILIGAGDAITVAVRARNAAGSPVRYEIDPRDHLEARRTARQAGLRVVGFYHSHPRSSAQASPTDVSEATYHDAVYLIVGRPDVDWDAKLYALDGQSARELPLQIY